MTSSALSGIRTTLILNLCLLSCRLSAHDNLSATSQQTMETSALTSILFTLFSLAFVALTGVALWQRSVIRCLKYNLANHSNQNPQHADKTSSKHENSLACAVFSYTSEGILITDAENKILTINTAFERLTGYQKEEVIGKKPDILQSGQHDESFYRQMWSQLKSEGYWRGEIWNRRKNGAIYPELLTINSIKDDTGNTTHFIAVFSDISELKNTEKRLDKLAHFDQVTNLPNRTLLTERLDSAIRFAQVGKLQLAVIFLDLDRFKRVNESFGHAAGDKLLKEISERLKATLSEDNTISRISSDEFVMIIEHVNNRAEVQQIIDQLMTIFESPFEVDGRLYNQTTSIGASLYPDDGINTSELLRSADNAMYSAKTDGRNTFRFFNKNDIPLTQKRIQLEIALQSALMKQELSLAFQPQYDLRSKQIVGVETLVRWHNPLLGNVSPAQFIPIAEQNGKVREIGHWVLEQACQQAVLWLDQGINFGRISVNVSSVQLYDDNFDKTVIQVLNRTGLSPDYLDLEVTESFVMNRIDTGIAQLNRLRDIGIKIAIDDFGTGYASLAYLKKLPVDKIKVDRSFVKDIPDDQDDLAITKAIISMGKALDLTVIAEGIETTAQNTILMKAGCTLGQGFWFSKPRNAEQILIFFRQTKSLC